MSDNKPVAFAVRVKTFFGYEKSSEVAKDIKDLTDQDKIDLYNDFNAAELPTLPPRGVSI